MTLTKDNVTTKDLRERLPGFEDEWIIAQCDAGKKKLTCHVSIRGCFDELVSVVQYRIYSPKLEYASWIGFNTLDEAKNNWDNC